MKHMQIKLIAAILLTTISLTIAGMVSYAWFTVSASPVVDGMRVMIGGTNTIQLAPDIQQPAADGTVLHYPGEFSNTLDFSGNPQYDILENFAGLTPVSTTNGKDWFLPQYYKADDPEVKQNASLLGQLRNDFAQENDPSHANLPADQAEKAQEGSYLYLDFWVTAPADYALRVSMDQQSGQGSYVMALPPVTKDENGVWQLDPEASQPAEKSVRVGFLPMAAAETDDGVQKALEAYQKSADYQEEFTAFMGNGDFLIYEPNGVSLSEDGSSYTYTVTNPVLHQGTVALLKDVRNELTVQQQSHWNTQTVQQQSRSGAKAGAQQSVETLDGAFERFTASYASIHSNDALQLNEMSAEAVQQSFYNNFLKGQFAPYITCGKFCTEANSLYTGSGARFAGAAEDVMIVQLQRNKPQRIRMFIWLEGQDADCADGSILSQLAVKLELAGGSH